VTSTQQSKDLEQIQRCRTRLRAKGILNTVWVKKENEDVYGLLFVDGSLLSLTCPRQGANRRLRPRSIPHKTTTILSRIDNTPLNDSTRQRNDDPNSVYQESLTELLVENYDTRIQRQGDFERIKQRAEQMKAEWVEQAA